MRFLSVNQLVNETLKIVAKTKQINIVFSLKENVKDKFNNSCAFPLLVILNTEEGKQVWDYNTIVEKYGEEIRITVPNTKNNKNGYTNLQISTEPSYSEKYKSYFYQRQYGDLTNKVILKAIESEEQKEQKHKKVNIEVLDI